MSRGVASGNGALLLRGNGLGERGSDMKRIIWALVMAVLLLVSPALPADAGGGPGGGYRGGSPRGGGGGYHGGGYSGGGYRRGGPYSYRHGGPRVFIGGLGWWWGNPYPYYAAPPVVIQQAPAEYIQQAPAPPQQAYWYFCQGAGAYYPYVKECPGGWMTVVPTPQ